MGVLKRRRWLLAVGVIGAAGMLLAGLALRGRGKSTDSSSTPTEKPAIAVTVEPVTARPVRRTVSVVGSLYGWEEVPITSKVEGRVVRLHRDVSDVVRPGDLLLEIDPTDYELAVNEARRALELELAKVGLKELPPARFDVSSLPPVARAASQEQYATARRDRMRRLDTTRAISAEDREQAENEYAVARANLRQAVLEAEATLAAARHRQAALETAQQRLKDTRIFAPTCSNGPPPNGVVVSSAHLSSEPAGFVVCQRSVSEGEIVRMMPFNTMPLFKLVIDHSLKLMATVPERHRGDVKVGQDAELTVEAYPGERFAGKVARVNPSVDRTSRTFQVEIHISNTDRRLSAGSFAKVAIQTKVDPTAPTVPEEALVSFAGVTKVFVVRDGKAHEVPVRTGVTLPDREHNSSRKWVEVEGDLPPGAQVVTSGQTKLAEGTVVRIRDQKSEVRGQRSEVHDGQ